jgi:hypothetical protein
VGAAGEFVAALAVFAAGVEGREHHLDARDPVLRVDVDRYAAAVVPDADRPVDMDGDLDAGTVAGEVLVHGIVENLGNTVVKRALIRAADVHAGLLADGFEALELAELRRIVSLGDNRILGRRRRVGRFGHAGEKKGDLRLRFKVEITSENGGCHNRILGPFFGPFWAQKRYFRLRT